MKSHLSHRPHYGTWPFELGLMLAVGVFFVVTGVYQTNLAPVGLRLIYWGGVMLAGGLVVISVETLYARHAPAAMQGFWMSLVLVALLATTPQTLIVALFDTALFRPHSETSDLPALWINVGIIVLPMVALLRLLRRTLTPDAMAATGHRPGTAVTGSDPAAALLPSDTCPPTGLADRLPTSLRRAELFALQAEDHYVRIHTSAGSDLVLIRFADALKLVEDRGGFRLHRSWWASAQGVRAARFSRGSGEAELAGGLKAPISRTYAPQLRRAGLFD